MKKRKLLTLPMEIYQREFDLLLQILLTAVEECVQFLLDSQSINILSIKNI